MDNLKELIKEVLEEYKQPTLILKENVDISEELKYHIENKMTLTNNIFRAYSKKYFDLINEVRELHAQGVIELNEEDTMMVESDTGVMVVVDGEEIYLDSPFIVENDSLVSEATHRGKKVNLGKPFRTPGGPKKFAVYVKKPGGGIKKVTFGDPHLKVKNANKKAAKSFRARHKCSQKKDRTTAGYWSCHVGRYSKQLGLSSSNSW
jgi:hypothetical protein